MPFQRDPEYWHSAGFAEYREKLLHTVQILHEGGGSPRTPEALDTEMVMEDQDKWGNDLTG